jgi:ribosome biogenesis GTPase
MTLAELGYNKKLEKIWNVSRPDGFETGRVVSEHKERYRVMTVKGEFEAEITGNMRFTAKSRVDFPAVGDWVALITYEPDYAIIHKVLSRFPISRFFPGIQLMIHCLRLWRTSLASLCQ